MLFINRLMNPTKGPKPSERQRIAIKRLYAGRGNDNDKDSLNALTDKCRKMGCPITEPGRSTREFNDCPGWCDLSARYARDKKALMAALGKDPGTAKPYRLGREAMRAYAALEAGSANASDILELEKLVLACKLDGCIVEGCTATSGIDACPGWCTMQEAAWKRWWSL